MPRRLSGASVIALRLAGAAAAQEAHDQDGGAESITLYRVFVGDHEAPRATAFDLGDPAIRWTFGTRGQAKLNVEVLDARALSEGRAEAVRFSRARAHHEVVVLIGDIRISSVASDEPAEAGALPPRVGTQVFTPDGEPASELATCTGLPREAFSGAYLVFGCDEGVPTVIGEGGAPVFRMRPCPADVSKGATTGTPLGLRVARMFLGDHGETGLVVIDPVGEPRKRRIEPPFRRVDFVLDPARPAHAYVLTGDGTLHRVNTLSAEIEASARVIGPQSLDGDWLAMPGEEIAMTDPNAGRVRPAADLTGTTLHDRHRRRHRRRRAMPPPPRAGGAASQPSPARSRCA